MKVCRLYCDVANIRGHDGLQALHVHRNEQSRVRGRVIVKIRHGIHFWMIFSLVTVATADSHAATVNYTLVDVILADGEQITGTFDWTFSAGDFEGGNGAFTGLEIPYTIYSFVDGNLNIDIQTNSIEISGNGNYHDVGLDITLFLSQPFTSTQSAPIDLGLSYFECCGNGFKDQAFRSGSISPTFLLPVLGDMDCDSDVDFDDIDDFVLGLNMPQEYENRFGVPPEGKGDTDGDGDLDFDDIDDFVAILNSPLSAGTRTVPEPGAAALLGVAMSVLAWYGWRRRGASSFKKR